MIQKGNKYGRSLLLLCPAVHYVVCDFDLHLLMENKNKIDGGFVPKIVERFRRILAVLTALPVYDLTVMKVIR